MNKTIAPTGFAADPCLPIALFNEHKKGEIVNRIAILVLCLSLSACESGQATQAQFEAAKSECSQVAAKTALAAPGSFDRAHEAIGVKTMKECMSARGFEVELK